MHSLTRFLAFFTLINLTRAQISTASSSGYTGYNLSLSQDPESATYDTLDTPANVSTDYPVPDVYLNASVHIGEIDILVANLTAKINLDAQVLSLLSFNAGVDLSIDRVSLTIQNVTAKVLLEARLANLVLMIDDVLSSLDLNPVLATLGQDLTNITTAVTSAITPSSTATVSSRSLDYDLTHNILYSSNNYAGQTHTNRILTQSGSIIDQFLDNNGKVSGERVVGDYKWDMSWNGDEVDTTLGGVPVRRLEYVYKPFAGLNVVSFVFLSSSGNVVKTQVVSEGFGGGMSTIGD